MDAFTLLAKLEDDSPTGPLAALCALGVDHLLAQPLRSFLSPDQVAKEASQALTGPGVELAIARHIKPAITRQLDRAAASDERLGALVPEEVVKVLEVELAKPVKIDPPLARALVDAEVIKETMGAVVQEAFGRFFKSTDSGNSGGGGLLGFAARGARGLKDVGKGLLGGFGDEIEKQFQKRAKDAMDASMSALQDKLAERLTAEETGRMIGKMRGQGVRRALKQKVAEAKRVPIDLLLAQAPAVLRHNLARPEVQAEIRKELEQLLTLEGDKSLKTILEEGGVYETLRAEVLAQATKHAATFVRSEAFSAWLAGLFR